MGITFIKSAFIQRTVFRCRYFLVSLFRHLRYKDWNLGGWIHGLSVYVWEDNTKWDVYGIVACQTGWVNNPAEYTGLAHYLEHVMFKGTDKIGALDWATRKAYLW